MKVTYILRKFDEAVFAAHAAPAGPAVLRNFLKSVRELADADYANLVLYGDDRTGSAFGFHELEGMPDYVPEMQRVPGYELIAAVKVPRARSMAQEIQWSEFLRSELYRRYYRQFGVLHHLYRDLTLGGRRARLVLSRSDVSPDFDGDECELVDRVSQHLEFSYARTGGPIQAPPAWAASASPIDDSDPVEQAARRFGLTPAERRLVRPLSNGSGLGNAAQELGISINTAKSRLRTIFEKAGVHSQAQLVRAILERPASQAGFRS